MKAFGIFGANLFQNHRRIGDAAALQNIGESGSGVFRIQVDIVREQGLMREQRPAQIKLAFHGLMEPGFEMLRDDLAQDQLLGEILGADHDVVARAAASEQDGG